jgi:anaerobic magnesium-protoporphyrin IX monomethyl ester cyclase
MSRILLIKPRFLSFEQSGLSHPMGLLYIGATLKNAGHEPKIHDCAIDYTNLQTLERTISIWKPDFIGISIIMSDLEQTKKIMGIIRNIMPSVPVTFGGPWPSANPEESIKKFGADFVVMGEGELVFPQLIDAIKRGLPTDSIPGTASIVDGHIKINSVNRLTEEELNTLPFPAWELLDHKVYAKRPSIAAVGRRPYMSIITSRGCPYKCAYCHQTMGKVFRRRSAKSVLAEMEELRFKYGFKEFEFIDDCFNLDRERMLAILTGIRDRLSDVKLHFVTGLRSDILEPENMVLFKQAGTVSACFAIETSSPRLQNMIHKNLNIEKATNAINAAVKAGIYSTGLFMLGFPTETYEEALSTIEFAVRSSLHRAFFFSPIPYPGTELAVMAAESIKNKSETIDLQKMVFFPPSSNLNISAMSDTELQSVLRSAYRRFYLNLKRILRLVMYHPRILSLPWYAVITLIKFLPLKRRAT